MQPFHFVRVSDDIRHGPSEEDCDPTPTRSFSEIWEQDAQWLMGPGLLSDVVHFLKGKSMAARMDPGRNAMDVFVPLPTVLDAISGERVQVDAAIPEALQPIFADCIGRIASVRLPDLELLRPLLYTAMTRHLLVDAGAILQDRERRRECCGRGELWKVAAAEFGFNPHILPRPAGMAI